jgi:hypothetical protein
MDDVTHMYKMLARGAMTAAAGALAVVVLAGCGLSSITSGIGGGMFGGGSGPSKAQVAGVTEEHLLSAAKADQGATVATGATGTQVSHGCPRFQVWPRDDNLTIYEPGRAGDALAVMHRGEITRTARECAIESGRVTVKYGFSGRVLLGPKGQAGLVQLPVNVFVTDAKRERIAQEVINVSVAVEADKPIGYFSAVRTVTIDVPQGARPGEFEVFVGFDQSQSGAG